MPVLTGLLLVLLATASPVDASILEVRPGAEEIVAASGPPGGPFAPSVVTYRVRNAGTAPIDWQVTRSQAWIALSHDGGSLAPGQAVTVTVSIDPAGAAALAGGGYSDDVTFVNLTTDTFVKTSGEVATGPTKRLFTLNVFRSGVAADQGFGATTAGGSQGAVHRVTTLADNGDDDAPIPGSLREAVSAGHRYVVFDVAGEIALVTHLHVRGAHVTIDGLTAPPPGITLRNYGLVLRGKRGAHDVVVRGLRIRDIVRAAGRDTQFDGIQVSDGAFNVVIDHVSVDGADDGSVDVTGDSHDVTVSWSILARPKAGKNMLVKYRASRVTIHHNLLVEGGSRNPQVELGDSSAPAADTIVDVRNNVVWNFRAGTRISGGANGNVVGNYYSKRSGAIQASPRSAAHVAGNVTSRAGEIVVKRSRSTPFPAPAVDTSTALAAACQVLIGAGARPFDALDLRHRAAVAIAGCPPGVAPTVALAAPGAGATLSGVTGVAATATGGVAAVRFFLDGLALGPELTQPPFAIDWDTATATDGPHTLHARVRDAAGVTVVSAGLNVTVRNAPAP
jgi:pectate lyase